MHGLIIANLLQAGVIAAPPAPPPPPPPVTRSGVPQIIYTDRVKPLLTTIDVEIRAGAETLWSGPMSVSNQQPSTFTRQFSSPAPNDCGSSGYGEPAQDSLSLDISPRRYQAEENGFGINLRWGRSLPGTCPYRKSSRTVEMSETIMLAPNQTITLKGDAGLTIRLHRR